MNHSDPNLLAARAEIEAILRKRNIAGFCSLHSPGMGEIFSILDPSWSKLIPVMQDGNLVGVRLRSKAADYGGDKERQARDLSATVGMVRGMAEALSLNGIDLLRVAEMFDAHTGAEHAPAVQVRPAWSAPQ
jgi:hypothetical protein